MRHAIVPPAFAQIAHDWEMSPAILADGFLFLNGFNGCPLDGAPSPDPAAQIRTAFDKVGLVLAAANTDWAHVLDITSFHRGLATHLEEFKTIRADFLAAPFPAWTAIEVAGFAIEDVVIGLKVVARAPAG